MRVSHVEFEFDAVSPGGNFVAGVTIIVDGEYAIHDLKLIRSDKGIFVSMPSRKVTDRCPGCRKKNHLRARYCNDCGIRLRDDRAPKDQETGRAKLYVDIAHPLNNNCRTHIQEVILARYQELIAERSAPATPDDFGNGILSEEAITLATAQSA